MSKHHHLGDLEVRTARSSWRSKKQEVERVEVSVSGGANWSQECPAGPTVSRAGKQATYLPRRAPAAPGLLGGLGGLPYWARVQIALVVSSELPSAARAMTQLPLPQPHPPADLA